MKESQVTEDVPKLDWIQLRQDMGTAHYGETAKEKMIRKLKENPFVPIGCGLTAAALSIGLWSFRRGKSELSQKMMRMRVLAQGFTVVALIGGVVLSTGKAVSNPKSN